MPKKHIVGWWILPPPPPQGTVKCWEVILPPCLSIFHTGVGCQVLLQYMKVKSESEVAQLCLTLSDLMDCSLPGSSVHGIFQARVLEWVPLPSPFIWSDTVIYSVAIIYFAFASRTLHFFFPEIMQPFLLWNLLALDNKCWLAEGTNSSKPHLTVICLGRRIWYNIGLLEHFFWGGCIKKV